MKIKLTITILSLSTLLTGCCISHDFTAASCTQPSTCTKCGETEGEILPHTWTEPTCAEPKTCSVCNLTEGNSLEHQWQEATTEKAKMCTLCGLTEGEPLPVEEEVELTDDEYQGDNPYDKEVDNYEGMSDEEIVQQMLNDFKKKHAQDNQIHVDIPGATPYDPSQDGDYHFGQGGELPDWAKGDHIN